MRFLSRSKAERALAASALSFLAFGLALGAWQVLLADLRTAHGLSPGALGTALSVGIAGALPAMALGGRLSDRFGPDRLVGTTALLMGVGLLGVAAADGYVALIAALLVFFAASGAYDVGINAGAIAVERARGGPTLPYLHAGFSGGATAGALAAGAALRRGVPFRTAYAAIAALLVAVGAAVLVRRALPNPAAAADAETGTAGNDDGGGRSPFRDPAVLLVALIVCLGMFAEGTLENWTAIYLRSSLGLDVAVGALGVAAFHGTMTAGRLGGARLSGAVDRRSLLVGAGALGAAGMAVSLATVRPPLVVTGFGAVGLAMAVVVPTCFSVAGDLAPERAGEASSALTFVGYGAFLIGPVLVGGVADAASLRVALALVVAAGTLVALLGARVPASGAEAGGPGTRTDAVAEDRATAGADQAPSSSDR